MQDALFCSQDISLVCW